MFGQEGTRHERRESLDELDAELRARLLRLDEPVDWSDWAAVTQRSRRDHRTGRRLVAVIGGGAALASLAAVLSFVVVAPDARHSRVADAPRPMALQMTDGSGLVVFSSAKTAQFIDTSDGRVAGQELTRTTPGAQSAAAVVRSLSAGPFPVAASRIAATTSLPAGPLPGDQALVSFDVLASTGPEPTAGTAVMTCQYGFDGTAFCDGAIDLEDGIELTASGTLDSKTNQVTLVMTSLSMRELSLQARTA